MTTTRTGQQPPSNITSAGRVVELLHAGFLQSLADPLTTLTGCALRGIATPEDRTWLSPRRAKLTLNEGTINPNDNDERRDERQPDKWQGTYAKEPQRTDKRTNVTNDTSDTNETNTMNPGALIPCAPARHTGTGSQ